MYIHVHVLHCQLLIVVSSYNAIGLEHSAMSRNRGLFNSLFVSLLFQYIHSFLIFNNGAECAIYLISGLSRDWSSTCTLFPNWVALASTRGIRTPRWCMAAQGGRIGSAKGNRWENKDWLQRDIQAHVHVDWGE